MKRRTMAHSDVIEQLPLPANLDIERFVLGSAMAENDAEYFAMIADTLGEDAFSLEKHRLIFRTMIDLHRQGRGLDRVSVADELHRAGLLTAVDGVSYLVSLDDGMPRVYAIEDYCRILSEKATLRKAIKTSHALITRCATETDAPIELVRQAEQLVQLLSHTQDSGLRTVQQIIDSHGGINNFLTPRQTRGIPWMFRDIENTLCGLRKKQLILLAARPGVGKSATAMQQGVYSAGRKTRTAIYTLEMSDAELLHRQIASSAEVSAQKLRRGDLNAFELDALADSTSSLVEYGDYLLVSDKPRISTATIAADLRRQAAKNRPVELLIVDYLQLMSWVGRFDNREQQVSSISRGLKLIAGEFDIPVLALVQLSRKADERKDGRPELSDLRESGSLEQDADVVIFEWWASQIDDDRDSIRKVNWRVAKQRQGPLNEGKLHFRKKFVRFEEPDMPGWEAA